MYLDGLVVIIPPREKDSQISMGQMLRDLHAHLSQLFRANFLTLSCPTREPCSPPQEAQSSGRKPAPCELVPAWVYWGGGAELASRLCKENEAR